MLNNMAKPILKWAGGKTQMLGDLLPKVPKSYGRYIEPFFGGGAMFFALQPENAIIADSNPELINMYRQVAENVDEVISYLKKYENTSEMFYAVREQEHVEVIPIDYKYSFGNQSDAKTHRNTVQEYLFVGF